MESEDYEDVLLDLEDFDSGSPDMLRLEERSLTKGSECQYINLLDVRNNQDCVAGLQSSFICYQSQIFSPGSKFVVKQQRGVRKQFLILNGIVVLAFVKKKGGKFANCRAFEDITSNVKCKVTLKA